MSEPILCYVEPPWALFTTQALEEQWGDDWNDAPYYCNAGPPYTPHREGESWEISRVAYDDIDLSTPENTTPHTYYSVEQINAREVPWLEPWYEESGLKVWAGTSLSEFINLVEENGGTIYVPRKQAS